MSNTPELSRREIVLVDSRVQDALTLLQGMRSGIEVVVLRSDEDGLAQMAAVVGGRADVEAVHVLAHGSEGRLWLGGTLLDSAALQRTDVQAGLAAVGRGLSPDGDLLLYACHLAGGEAGLQFVSHLADLTGADVAASIDATGNVRLGGNWTLEVQAGNIASDFVWGPEALSQFSGLLGIASENFESVGTPNSTTSLVVNGWTFSADSGIDIHIRDGAQYALVINTNGLGKTLAGIGM